MKATPKMHFITVVGVLGIITSVGCFPDDLLEEPGCGQFVKRPTARVIGGREFIRGKWPSHVAIYEESNYVNKYHPNSRNGNLAIAASCFEREFNDSRFRIEAGDRRRLFETDVQTRTILSTHEHPDWIGSVNDVALLKLEKPFKFNRYVQPACIPKKEHSIELGTITTLVGWAATEINPSRSNGIPSEVNLPKVDLKKCKRTFPYADMDDQINFCAGFRDGSLGACKFDSGASLMIKWNKRWFVFGIPALFKESRDGYLLASNISGYADWIKSIVLKRRIRPNSKL